MPTTPYLVAARTFLCAAGTPDWYAVDDGE
jgi:hypothetical protein